ncbi:uncharacterized protein VTP21DRAFT_6953 [Calcarisporiella thermophila]|uniref:uncharacterized protein n=1 Tax=Calcarisporiella thermophila TaxID=911321 RepID=UPI003742C3E2
MLPSSANSAQRRALQHRINRLQNQADPRLRFLGFVCCLLFVLSLFIFYAHLTSDYRRLSAERTEAQMDPPPLPDEIWSLEERGIQEMTAVCPNRTGWDRDVMMSELAYDCMPLRKVKEGWRAYVCFGDQCNGGHLLVKRLVGIRHGMCDYFGNYAKFVKESERTLHQMFGKANSDLTGRKEVTETVSWQDWDAAVGKDTVFAQFYGAERLAASVSVHSGECVYRVPFRLSNAGAMALDLYVNNEQKWEPIVAGAMMDICPYCPTSFAPFVPALASAGDGILGMGSANGLVSLVPKIRADAKDDTSTWPECNRNDPVQGAWLPVALEEKYARSTARHYAWTPLGCRYASSATEASCLNRRNVRVVFIGESELKPIFEAVAKRLAGWHGVAFPGARQKYTFGLVSLELNSKYADPDGDVIVFASEDGISDDEAQYSIHLQETVDRLQRPGRRLIWAGRDPSDALSGITCAQEGGMDCKTKGNVYKSGLYKQLVAEKLMRKLEIAQINRWDIASAVFGNNPNDRAQVIDAVADEIAHKLNLCRL